MEHLVESIIRLDQKLFFLLNGAHCEFLDTVMKVCPRSRSAIPDDRRRFLHDLAPETGPDGHRGHIAYVPAHRPDLFLPDKKLGTKAQTIAYPGMGRDVPSSGRKRRSLFIRLVTRQQRFWAGVLYQLDIQKKMVYHSHSHPGAILVSYSRIYVGKHFPLDVICGALTGLLLGWAVYRLYKWIITKTVTKCAALMDSTVDPYWNLAVEEYC